MAFAATRPGLVAPGLLGAGLVVVLLAEAIGGPGVPMPGRSASLLPASTASAPARARDAAADAATIDARPLFSSSRRPAASAATTVAGRGAPRLSAIFIGGVQKACVFDDGGHPLLAHEGGHAGPYTVVAIGADRVTVTTPDGTHVLRPTALPPGAEETASNAPSGPTPPTVGSAPAIQNLIARLRAMRGN